MSKKMWYQREKVAVATLYYHCRDLRENDRWQFLVQISEDELVALGKAPLRQIRNAWVSQYQSCESITENTMATTELYAKIGDLRQKKHWEQLMKERIEELNGCRRVLSYIDELLARAEYKPVIPQLREDFSWCRPNLPDWDAARVGKYFNQVMFCIPRDFYLVPDVISAQDEGRVIPGRISNITHNSFDTIAYMRLEQSVTNAEGEQWEREVYSCKNPIIIGRWEYDYLKSHPDFSRLWLKYYEKLPYPFQVYAYAYDIWKEEFGAE